MNSHYEREERDRQTDGQGERERERDGGGRLFKAINSITFVQEKQHTPLLILHCLQEILVTKMSTLSLYKGYAFAYQFEKLQQECLSSSCKSNNLELADISLFMQGHNIEYAHDDDYCN